MAELIRVSDLRGAYARICNDVMLHGREVAPRGVPTYEVDDVIIEMAYPALSLPTGTGRRLHTAIGAAEALQLIACESHPELMCRIAPNMRQFMQERGNNLYQHGAYGLRIRKQLPGVITLLRHDPSTRQAVMNIWQGDKDITTSPDIPCTLSIRFAIRDALLQMTVVMRSNDVWWGLPYDAFQFASLQATVARCLDVAVGPYTHHAMSLHAYARDSDAISKLHSPKNDIPVLAAGVGRARGGAGWGYYANIASDLLAGSKVIEPTPSEAWFAMTLDKYTKEEG